MLMSLDCFNTEIVGSNFVQGMGIIRLLVCRGSTCRRNARTQGFLHFSGLLPLSKQLNFVSKPLTAFECILSPSGQKAESLAAEHAGLLYGHSEVHKFFKCVGASSKF